MKQPSQCDRVLAVLNDGQWHRMEEIHQRAGFMRLNSRISDLRDRGHIIECDKSGRIYRYRLLETLPDELLSSSPQASPSSLSAPEFLSPITAVLPPEGGRGEGEVPLFDMSGRKPAWS